MSEELKRAKRAKELKHKQDKMNLSEIKDQLIKGEQTIMEYENKKHRLFADFKKLLNDDDNRKNLQKQKEANAITLTFGQSLPQPQLSTPLSVPGALSSLPLSNKNDNPSSTPSIPNQYSNSSPLKFNSLTQLPSGPSALNQAISNNAILSFQQQQFFAHTSIPPPQGPIPCGPTYTQSPQQPAPTPPNQHGSITNNGSSSFSHKPQLNNPSIYSNKTIPPPQPPAPSSSILMNQLPSTSNQLLSSSMSAAFQNLPPSPNDRQRSYKRTADSLIPVPSTLPGLNLVTGVANQPGPQISPYIGGYKPPPLNNLHPVPQPPNFPLEQLPISFYNPYVYPTMVNNPNNK